MDLHLCARVVPAAAAAVLLLTLAGCGGDDGADDDGSAASAPEDASRADFCEAFLDEPADFDSDDVDAAVAAAHDYADRLREVGTPDVPDEAREGFEVYVDFLAGLSADDAGGLDDADPAEVFSDEQLAKFEAFSEVTADCGPGEF